MADEKKNEQQQEKKGGSFLTKLILILLVLIMGFGGFLMYRHSSTVGKAPWKWGGEEWSSFASFASDESKEIGSSAAETAKSAGAKLKEWAGNLDSLLKKARQGTGEEEGGTAVTVGTEGTAANVDAECLNSYREGCKALAEAVPLYKHAQKLQVGTGGTAPDATAAFEKYTEAKKHFDTAVTKLEKAKELDPNVDPELDDLIGATKEWQEACEETMND